MSKHCLVDGAEWVPCHCFVGDPNDLSKQYWVDAGCSGCNGTGRVESTVERVIEIIGPALMATYPHDHVYHWIYLGNSPPPNLIPVAGRGGFIEPMQKEFTYHELALAAAREALSK